MLGGVMAAFAMMSDISVADVASDCGHAVDEYAQIANDVIACQKLPDPKHCTINPADVAKAQAAVENCLNEALGTNPVGLVGADPDWYMNYKGSDTTWSLARISPGDKPECHHLEFPFWDSAADAAKALHRAGGQSWYLSKFPDE